jgi:uncharacterized protein (DUF952 family)
VLIYKIVPRAEWDAAGEMYEGSAHDRADGFLHFSTASELAETLRLHYAGRDDLMLVAVAAASLGAALRWDHVPSRGADFPHLHAPLARAAIAWARPLARRADGGFVLPVPEQSPA